MYHDCCDGGGPESGEDRLLIYDLLSGYDDNALVVVGGTLADERAFDFFCDREIQPCFGEYCDICLLFFDIFENLCSFVSFSN